MDHRREAQSAPELESCGETSELSKDPVEVPNCLVCGACCFSFLKTYVRVSGDDHAGMGDDAETFTDFIENRCYMRLVDGHCAALTIDGRTSQLLCAIYECRPAICRNLERGSPECLFERATKADRSATALRQLAEGPGHEVDRDRRAAEADVAADADDPS